MFQDFSGKFSQEIWENENSLRKLRVFEFIMKLKKKNHNKTEKTRPVESRMR